MNISSKFLFLILTGWLLGLMLGVMSGAERATAVSLPPPPPPTSPFMAQYPIPIADSQPQNILTTAPGHIWFTAQNANAIGQLVVTSTLDYQFTMHPIPTAHSQPYDLAYDGQSIWFTELAGNQIGQLVVSSGVISEHAIPTPDSAPTGIDVTPDGRIWFTQRDGNNLAYYDPIADTFSEFPYPRAGAMLDDVAASQNDHIWFIAPGVDIPRLVEYRPSLNVFTEAAVGGPGVSYLPSDLLLDEQTTPWVSTVDAGLIGRFLPSTITFFLWRAVSPDTAGLSAITQFTANNQRHTWFTETNSGYVGRLSTGLDGSLRFVGRTPLPTANSQPAGISVDANQHVWITAPGTNHIVEWISPYFYMTYLPVVRSQ